MGSLGVRVFYHRVLDRVERVLPARFRPFYNHPAGTCTRFVRPHTQGWRFLRVARCVTRVARMRARRVQCGCFSASVYRRCGGVELGDWVARMHARAFHSCTRARFHWDLIKPSFDAITVCSHQ